MIKLNFWRRLLVNFIYLIGLGIMILLPAYLAIKEIYENIQLVPGNQIKLNWALAGVIILIMFAGIYIKYLRKVFHRKLQSLAVRDEIGIMPAKGILGMITDRLLRTIEWVYPFVVTLGLLYIFKYAFGQFDVFSKLYDMNVFLLYMGLGGFGVMLLGDFVKVNFMQRQEIDDKLDLKAKSNKQSLKELKKAKKKALEALAVEKELALLKEETSEHIDQSTLDNTKKLDSVSEQLAQMLKKSGEQE